MSDNPEINQEATETAPESLKMEQVAEAPVEAPKSWLSEELISQSNLKDFKDPDSLAKSYLELQRMVGNSVRIPSDDASDEAKQDFYNKIKDMEGVIIKDDESFASKIGVPEAPDKYQFELDEGLADELGDDLAKFKEMAHQLKIPQEAAEALVKDQVENYIASKQAQETAKAETLELLKKEWGQDYDNRLEAAKHTEQLLSKKFGDSPAGQAAMQAHMMSELASLYREKGHEGYNKVEFGMTPSQARAKIHDRRADRGFMQAYHDDADPRHNEVVQELTKLYQIANS